MLSAWQRVARSGPDGPARRGLAGHGMGKGPLRRAFSFAFGFPPDIDFLE